ncbi:ELWxxDGT repeat protein [Hyalangium minutum]|nr:ELWxxDGT repeat protein [Hyalangium minutum]
MIVWRVVAVLLGCFWWLTGCGPLSEPGEASLSLHSRFTLDSQCTPPARVRDIHPGPASAFPSRVDDRVPQLAAARGWLFFGATDGALGEELWRSDGTAAGTQRVKDISPGASPSSPTELTPAQDGLFFSASEGVSGRELWWSDGTPERTKRVADVAPGAADSSPAELTVVGERLFFTADDGTHGSELWMHHRTDGSTGLVKDIRPGSFGAVASELTALGDKLLFSANDGALGQELWISDGTAQGTAMVKNIFKLYDSSPQSMVVMNGRAYFSADDDEWGREVWWSDGTLLGTDIVANIWPELADSNPTSLTVVGGNKLFFAATEPFFGRKLWVSDGSESGTVRVMGQVQGSEGSSPQGLTAAGDQLFFLAYDDQGQIGLWRTDGTEEGTRWLKREGIDSSGHPPPMKSVGKVLYFAGSDASSGTELWKSDGTVEGTVQVMDLVPGPGGSFPRDLTRAGSKLFFVAHDPEAGEELWALDLCDRAPPLVTCPAAISVEATSLQGMPVSFAAIATDDFTEAPVLEYSQASGSTFPLGRTEVAVTARDEAGNTASCTFPVTVQDTTPPVLRCPSYTFIEASGTGSVVVQYPEVVASDTLSPVSIAFDPPNGSALPIGDVTPVTVTATDQAGNTKRCQFKVAVENPDAEGPDSSSGCGCGAQSSGWAGGSFLCMVLALIRTRRMGEGKR